MQSTWTRRTWLGATILCSAAPAKDSPIPPGGDHADEHLNRSPRHGEWITVTEGAPGVDRWHDEVRAWISYPERATRAPAVLVIHEIFGLTNWIRAVADQLAAEGFLAIAPDLLSGQPAPENPPAAVKLVSALRIEDVARRLTAVARYASAMPAASGKFGCVGFCWGGSTSFAFAGNEPRLSAAVVYYGTSPDKKTLGRIQAPVLGLYGASDARVNNTIPEAEAEMQRLKRSFHKEIFAGAGHAFLRQQSGQGGANLAAAQKAWPATIGFLKQQLERKQG